MKVIFFLAAFAVLTVSLGQCQDCSAVTACIGQDFKEKINRKAQASDFPAICIDFKVASECISNAAVSSCTVAGAAALTTLRNMTHNMCGPDGKLTGCGMDVYKCIQTALIIQDDYKNNNVSGACPVIAAFSKCAEAIRANKECASDVTAGLIDAETTFKSDAMITGCYGPCAQAIGNCTFSLAKDLSGLSVSKTNWTDFCKNAYLSLTCMRNLQQANTVCSSQSNQVAILNAQLASQDAYLKDYCDVNGNPSQCVVGLNMCSADIVTLTPQSDVKTQCLAAKKFLECTSSLPCEQELSAVVKSMRTQFQTGETAQNCPTIGSCNTRLGQCQSADAQLKTVTNGMSNPAFCKIVTSALSCFDFVRNDPICERENMMVSEFETAMAVDAAPVCGATIGNCIDRIKICDDFEHIINNINTTTTKDQFCNKTRQGINCFDTVRKDANCTQDKVQVTGWENKIRNVIGPLCGDASIVHIPFILLVACLLVSVDNIWAPLWKRVFCISSSPLSNCYYTSSVGHRYNFMFKYHVIFMYKIISFHVCMTCILNNVGVISE
ncbi:hypothetical protein Btru_071414 [Bulinus truncatus]|nr:hypothetical protein Btru_071414 [Bulinus truncatus]